MAESGPEDDRSELLADTSASIKVRLELSDWLARRLIEPIGPPQTSWDHLALASLALDAALDGAPTARTEHLADRALSGIGLLGDVRLADHVRSMAGLAYLLVDRFDRSAALFDELIGEPRRWRSPAWHARPAREPSSPTRPAP